MNKIDKHFSMYSIYEKTCSCPRNKECPLGKKMFVKTEKIKDVQNLMKFRENWSKTNFGNFERPPPQPAAGEIMTW